MLLLQAVYCGCVRTVIVLWLRGSRGLRVLLRLSGTRAGARWSPPITPLYAIRARPVPLALSGSAAWCCLGLSYHHSLPSVGVSLLQWKRTNNLVSESAFQSLLPSGGIKPLFLPQLEQSAVLTHSVALPGSWQRAAWMEPEVLGITGVCRPLQTRSTSVGSNCARRLSPGEDQGLKSRLRSPELKESKALHVTGQELKSERSPALWVLHSCISIAVHR